MRKIFSLFLLTLFAVVLSTQGFATLTVGNIPSVKTGGTTPTVQNSPLSTDGTNVTDIGTMTATGFITSGGGSSYLQLAANASDTSQPASGYGTIYEKTDKNLYFQNDAGTISNILTGTNYIGIGAASSASYPLLIQTNLNTGNEILLRGTSLGGTTDNTNGGLIRMDYNATTNRQIFLGDSATSNGIEFITGAALTQFRGFYNGSAGNLALTGLLIVGQSNSSTTGQTLVVKNNTASTGTTTVLIQGGAADTGGTTGQIFRINQGGGTTSDLTVLVNGNIGLAGVTAPTSTIQTGGTCAAIGPVGTCWTATGQLGYCSGSAGVCTSCTAC